MKSRNLQNRTHNKLQNQNNFEYSKYAKRPIHLDNHKNLLKGSPYSTTQICRIIYIMYNKTQERKRLILNINISTMMHLPVVWYSHVVGFEKYFLLYQAQRFYHPS